MKHLSRVAAVATATAVGAATLVATAPAANAAVKPVTTTYNCPVLGSDTPMDMTITIKLPAKGKAGKAVAAQPFSMSVDVPASILELLPGFGVTELGGRADGVAFTVGKTKVPVKKVVMPATALPEPGNSLTVAGKGKSSPFKIKKAGTYAVKVPQSFSFVPLNQDGAEVVPGFALTCTLTGPGSAGSFKVTK